MSVRDHYVALGPTATPAAVEAALNAIINAFPGQISPEDRTSLTKKLFDDLQNKDSRIYAKDRPLALLALKTLGRSPDAAQIIATKPSLEFLLTIADISLEVPRMMANALLLHAPGRQNFVAVGGGDYAFNLLSSSTDTASIFLACRLLFLSTHDSANIQFTTRLVNDTTFLEVTISKMKTLTKKIDSSGASYDPMARDAFTDMLKYTYSIILHYSRAQTDSKSAMGEVWSNKFNCLIRPLLKAYGKLPNSITPTLPFTAPMTHLIHCLLSVPVEGNESDWFHERRSPSPPTITSRARSLLSYRPSISSSSRQSSPTSSGSENGSSSDIVHRTFDLVCKCLEHYFPGNCDVDSKDVRAKALQEATQLDELLPPPILLLRKLASDNSDAKRRLKNWILPDDLDRTTPLEGRDDILGRLIRLLSSVYFPRIQNCAGELLFAICDSDSTAMSHQIGYGNAAGYLFNKGILSAPPGKLPTPSSSANSRAGPSRAAITAGPSSSSSSSSSSSPGASTSADAPDINPITGTVYEEIDTKDLDEMTEEEKEAEAEKLFVLFDRLEKRGFVQNPIRVAQQKGELEKYRTD